MKYAVDKIEDDIVVLENVDNNEIIEVEIKKLPSGIHEGSVVLYENNQYSLDEATEANKKECLRERLERLKKLKK